VRKALGLTLLLLLGCERRGLQGVLGDVQVSSAALHFQTTFIGLPKTRTLTLVNGSRSDRALTAKVEAPFSTPAELLVPGGAAFELTVTFAPSEKGPAQATLQLSDGKRSFEIALDGEGAPVPACAPSGPCRASSFDGKACVETLSADGSACSSASACIEGGMCSAGICVGAARDCGDGDRCTEDACEPGGGCVHYAAACADPADPCKVASCDPVLGCVAADAPDGTACGAADCVTAKVCLSGQCKAVAVPDGAACGVATPCQASGVCQAQSCVRPAVQPLVEAWSYGFPGEQADFRGVTDSAQNLYWVECTGLGCAAISYTRDGVQRFRQPLPQAQGATSVVLHLIAADHLVYAIGTSVGAVSTTNGAVEWSVPLADALQGGPDTAEFFSVRFLVADGIGHAWALVQRNQGSNVRQDALLELDVSSGAVLQRRFYDAETVGGAVDEHDNLFLGAWVSGTGAQLFSLNAQGAERFRIGVMADPTPVAAYHGEVMLKHGEVRSALDGSLRALGMVGTANTSPVMSAAARGYLFQTQSYGCCTGCECKLPVMPPEIDAASFAPGTAMPSWQVTIANTSGTSVPPTISNPLGTRAGDMLFTVTTNVTPSTLEALTAAGTERFSCELPEGLQSALGYVDYTGAAALLNGRWAVLERIECRNCTHNPNPRLRIFETPGLAAPQHGWVSPGGASAGASRPLP
jgi:hypothetical protein